MAIPPSTLIAANHFPFLAPFKTVPSGPISDRVWRIRIRDYLPKRGRLGRRIIVPDFRAIAGNLPAHPSTPFCALIEANDSPFLARFPITHRELDIAPKLENR